MLTVFHARLHSRFTEIQSNLRRKKLQRTNQDYNFLRGSFSNRDKKKPQSNLEEKVNSSILKDDFSSETDSSIFKSIASGLLDQSNQTS